MTIPLRRFEPGDATACCAIMNAAIQAMDGLNPQARSLVTSKNIPETLGPELARSFTLVAVVPDGIGGLGVLDSAEVKRVYVHPRVQSRGIGTKLVQALEAEARRRGAHRLELQASPSSVRFYLRLGFRELVKETSRNGDAEFIHVKMFKDLA